MSKKPRAFFFFIAGLLILTLACQPSELFQFTLIGPADREGESNFVPPRETIRVKAGEPVALESYHINDNRVKSVQLFVNGQPVRPSEEGREASFPANLALVRILVRGASLEPVPAGLRFPSPHCRNLAEQGGLAFQRSRDFQYPSSTGIVCYVWIGQTPGTYDLSFQVTDQDGKPGQRIRPQRIEVID